MTTESGELPSLPETEKMFGQGFNSVQMRTYARQAIAADRAPRQVANKAEVDLSSLNVQTGADIELVYCNRDEEFVRLDDVKALLATPPATTGASTALRPTDDDLWDATLRDRDAYHEWADKLADAIAKHFGVDIGEHSNQNCPWHEALEAIESAEPARRAQPEGEAPQAEARIVTYVPSRAKKGVFKITAYGPPDMILPAHREIISDRLMYPAAQHAESADLPREWISEIVGPEVDDLSYGQGYRRGWNDCREKFLAALAAQSQGAPTQPQSVSDERKSFDAYWSGLSGEGATEAELEVAENAAWWAWQARPRHCLALPLSAYPKGTTYLAAQQAAAPGALEAWFDAEQKRLDAVSAYNAAVLVSEREIWPGRDTNPEFQAMSAAQNAEFHARGALFASRAAPSAPGTPEAPKGGAA